MGCLPVAIRGVACGLPKHLLVFFINRVPPLAACILFPSWNMFSENGVRRLRRYLTEAA